MTALDLQSVQAWSKVHGYALNDRGLPVLRDAEHCETFDIPSDAGRRVALVRGHLHMFEEEDEVCVWLFKMSSSQLREGRFQRVTYIYVGLRPPRSEYRTNQQ